MMVPGSECSRIIHVRHGRRRRLRATRIRFEAHGRMRGGCALRLRLHGLVCLVCPCACAVPRRGVDVESRQAAMEAHVPVHNIPPLFRIRLGRREMRGPVACLGVDHHG